MPSLPVGCNPQLTPSMTQYPLVVSTVSAVVLALVLVLAIGQ